MRLPFACLAFLNTFNFRLGDGVTGAEGSFCGLQEMPPGSQRGDHSQAFPSLHLPPLALAMSHVFHQRMAWSACFLLPLENKFWQELTPPFPTWGVS